MLPKSFSLGDTLILKKNHACSKSSRAFTVARLGSDVKIVCQSCGHDVTLPRVKLEKSIKSIVPKDNDTENINV